MIRIFFNPLDAKSVVEYPIAEGTQLIHFLQSNYPSGFDGALRVFVGIDELDLSDLDYEVQAEDLVTMLVMPSGPGTWTIVGKILIHALVAAAIGYALNLLFPPKTPSFGDDGDESAVYSLSPTRNDARLGQPIASHYGVVSHPPPYASAPYVFFWDGSNDQYVDEILCLGQGKYEIQDIIIGETPLSAIQQGTVKYWVFDPDDHQQQMGRIGDYITNAVANTETPFSFHENVFTSPEIENFQFEEQQNEENSTPVAIAGDAYAAGVDSGTGLYLLGRIEGVDDTLLISGGDTIELAGTVSNNISFVVGSVAPTPGQVGKMTLFQQWAWGGSQITTELGLSGTFTTNVLVDGMTGGPFRVQKIGSQVNRIDCDIQFPQGLFRVDGTSGKIKTYSVELQFIYQEIDATGAPIGSPVLQNRTWLSKSRIPLRATVTSGLLPPGEYECSVRRVNPVSDDSRETDICTWTALKGYVSLDRNAVAYGGVTLVAFRLKATNGIAAAARSRIRVIAKRILDVGESDNPITIIKDIWTDPTYGLGFPVAQLDPAMDDLETYWGDPLGPKFNGSFDQRSTGFDGMQSVASMAGSRVVNNGALTNVVPERRQTVRTALFTTANIIRDSLSIIYTFDALGDFKGNKVEFRDPVTFDARYVYAPEQTDNPESFTLFGSTDETYTQEMANYLWNVKQHRRKLVRFQTELEGLIPSFGQRIGVSHTMPDWGQSGVFVQMIDALTWMVDQPLNWSEGNVIILRDDVGLPSSPYTVTQGINPNIVVFTEIPTIYDQQGREPTSYAFGTAINVISDFVVSKITPKGENIIEIEAQNYSEEIYEDAPWQMDELVCKVYACDSYVNALSGLVDRLWLLEDDPAPAFIVDVLAGSELDAVVRAGSPVPTSTILQDVCGSGGSMRVADGGYVSLNPIGYSTSLSNGFGAFFRTADAQSLNAMFAEIGTANSPNISLTPSGAGMAVMWRGISYTYPTGFDGKYVWLNFTLTDLGASGDKADIEVFYDWVSQGQQTLVQPAVWGLPSQMDGFHVGNGSGNGAQELQYAAYKDGHITPAQAAILADALAQNKPAYLDPRPECTPCKVYECDAYRKALLELTPVSYYPMNVPADLDNYPTSLLIKDYSTYSNDLPFLATPSFLQTPPDASQITSCGGEITYFANGSQVGLFVEGQGDSINGWTLTNSCTYLVNTQDSEDGLIYSWVFRELASSEVVVNLHMISGQIRCQVSSGQGSVQQKTVDYDGIDAAWRDKVIGYRITPNSGDANSILEFLLDFAVVDSFTVLGKLADGPTLATTITTGYMAGKSRQESVLFNSALTDEQLLSLKSSWDQNQTTYLDPRPECTPLPTLPLEVIYESNINIQGYGQDRLVNVGATATEMLINPLGYGPLQWTEDGGTTWAGVDFSTNSSGRLCQDMTRIGDDWWILGYRPDQRSDRSWQHTGTPDGTWTFTNDQTFSYNHGVYYENANTFWRYDGNNNGPGVLRKYVNQIPFIKVYWQSDWNYTTPETTSVPGVGVIIQANDNTGSLRINKTSLLGDESANLEALINGDTINGPNVSWLINGITDNGTWIDFSVTPASQGSPDGANTFIFETEQANEPAATFTSTPVEDFVGQMNAYAHRRANNLLYITYQGTNGTWTGYMVWDITLNTPAYVGNWDTEPLNLGLTAVSNGSSVICTAPASLGGTVGTSAVVQTLTTNGVPTETFMNFGVAVDLVCSHYENSKFIITATVVGDFTKLRYGFGKSGTWSGEITLPYPCSTSDSQREVRHLNGNRYAIGYLANNGVQDATLVVIKVDLV